MEIIYWQSQIQALSNHSAKLLSSINRWISLSPQYNPLAHIFLDLIAIDLFYLYQLGDVTYTPSKTLTITPKELFDLTDQQFLEKMKDFWSVPLFTLKKWAEIFKTTREHLLSIFKNKFQDQAFDTKRNVNQFLNRVLTLTIQYVHSFFLGSNLEMTNEFYSVQIKRVWDLTKNNFPLQHEISPELFRTFINAVKAQNKSRVLNIQSGSGYYVLSTWLNGLATTVTDTDVSNLINLNKVIESYQSLSDQQLIAPLTGQADLPPIILLQDHLPALSRFYDLELSSYSGVILYNVLSTLKEEDMLKLLQRIVELHTSPGYFLIHETLYDTNHSTINNQLIKDISGINESFTQELIEKLFKDCNYNIMLRTKQYNVLPSISWLLTKK